MEGGNESQAGLTWWLHQCRAEMLMELMVFNGI